MGKNDDARGIERRRILLVFDLNGLFVERFRNGKFTRPHAVDAIETERAVEIEDAVPRASSPVSSRTRGAATRLEVVEPDFRVGRHNHYVRRYTEEFLRWAHGRFDVAVWSSAMEVNTTAMVENIWPSDLRSKIAFVLNQDHCAVDGVMKTKGGSKGTKPKFLKPLSVVWEKFADRFDAMNTLLIDDDAYKAIRNPANTAIHPKPFSVATRDSDDGLSANGALRKYLARLLASDSVPDFVKANRFIDGQHDERSNEGFVEDVAKSIETVNAKLAALRVQEKVSRQKTKPGMRIPLPKSLIMRNAAKTRTIAPVEPVVTPTSERTRSTR